MLSLLFSRRRSIARLASELSRLSVEIGASLIFAARSFSEMFTSYSHDSLFALPAGLRLETAAKIDKKKTEIYFSSH